MAKVEDRIIKLRGKKLLQGEGVETAAFDNLLNKLDVLKDILEEEIENIGRKMEE